MSSPSATAIQVQIQGPDQTPNQGANQPILPEITFNGLSNALCDIVNGGIDFRPSDMALAVGQRHEGVLQAVNDCIGVFDKSGNLETYTSTPLFFGVDPVANPLTADPRLIYDWTNHRFLFLVATYPVSCTLTSPCTGPAFYNLAVSRTENPAGSWCMYQLNVATTPNPQGVAPERGFLFPDFPRLGQDREAVYLASNLFLGDSSDSFKGEEIIALRKADLYECRTARRTSFTGPGINSGVRAFTLQPVNMLEERGRSDHAPKSMYFISSYSATLSTKTNQLNLAAIHDPFGNPSYSQVTILGKNTYSRCPLALQKGGTPAQFLETDDARISATPHYAGGSIYAALNTLSGNFSCGVILYQVEPVVDTSETATDGRIIGGRVLNEVFLTVGDKQMLFYPALVADREGNSVAVMGFSSDNSYASVLTWSHLARDPFGTIDSGVILQAGLGIYGGGRWGDYFATAPGGRNGGPLMWFAGQYASDNPGQWKTTIGGTRLRQDEAELP